MSFRIAETAVLDDVGRRLSEALTGRSVKEVQAFAGHVSHPTAIKLRRGEMPAVLSPIFSVLRRLGQDTAAWVLEPLIGSRNQINLAARLDELDRNLGALRHDLSRSSPAVVAGVPHQLSGAARGDVGAAGRNGGGSRQAGVSTVAGAEGGRGHAALAETECASISSVRLGLDQVTGGSGAPLARLLNLWHERGGKIDAAAAHEIADRELAFGIATRDPDRGWVQTKVAGNNRLIGPKMIGRPLLEHPDANYGRRIVADLDAVASEGVPMAFDVAGVVRAPEPVATLYRVVRTRWQTPREILTITAAIRADLGVAA